MKLRVRVLARAQRDLEEVAAYLRREAPESADLIIAALLDALDQLARLPTMGPRPRDPRLAQLGFRVLTCERYLVFYKLVGAQVRIYRVLHQRHAYAELL